jgi:hypothetical protein
MKWVKYLSKFYIQQSASFLFVLLFTNEKKKKRINDKQQSQYDINLFFRLRCSFMRILSHLSIFSSTALAEEMIQSLCFFDSHSNARRVKPRKQMCNYRTCSFAVASETSLLVYSYMHTKYTSKVLVVLKSNGNYSD